MMGGGSGGGGMMGGPEQQQEEQVIEVVDTNLTPEGAYILDKYEFAVAGEIIIDNEDPELFFVSDAPASGYLNHLVDMGNDNHMKYKSTRTSQAPYKWTLTSGQAYYGEYLMSALTIRNGDGSQYVQWKIPVEKGKRYSLYFATSVPDQVRMSRDPRRRNNSAQNLDLSYDFTIDNGAEESQKLKFDLKKLTNSNTNYSWEWMGDYNAERDTIVLTLSNKSELTRITADAVKAVEI